MDKITKIKQGLKPIVGSYNNPKLVFGKKLSIESLNLEAITGNHKTKPKRYFRKESGFLSR